MASDSNQGQQGNRGVPPGGASTRGFGSTDPERQGATALRGDRGVHEHRDQASDGTSKGASTAVSPRAARSSPDPEQQPGTARRKPPGDAGQR